MVCFGIRDEDGTYSKHGVMMRERLVKNEQLKIMNGRVDQVGDLWVVQFDTMSVHILGFIGKMIVLSFIGTWLLYKFSTVLCIISIIITILILLKNRLWYYLFKIAAKKKYGAKALSYVNQETIISEVFAEWDKTKSING